MTQKIQGPEEPQVDKVPCMVGLASLGGAMGFPTDASQAACGPERGKDFDSDPEGSCWCKGLGSK